VKIDFHAVDVINPIVKIIFINIKRVFKTTKKLFKERIQPTLPARLRRSRKSRYFSRKIRALHDY
jgi:hypothetical protein